MDDREATQQESSSSWSLVKILLIVLIAISMVVSIIQLPLEFFHVHFLYEALDKYLMYHTAKGSWRLYLLNYIFNFTLRCLVICAIIAQWYCTVIIFTILFWIGLLWSLYHLLSGQIIFVASFCYYLLLGILGFFYIGELETVQGKRGGHGRHVEKPKQAQEDSATSIRSSP